MNPIHDHFYRHSLELFAKAVEQLGTLGLDSTSTMDDAHDALNRALHAGTTCGRALGELRHQEQRVNIKRAIEDWPRGGPPPKP